MAKYYPITQQEMAAFLEGQGFRRMTLPNITELVWGKRVDRDGQMLSLRIYTGINRSGTSRDVGTDAIRVQIFFRDTDGTVVRVGTSKRVHRVRGWKKNLLDRIDNWHVMLGPACPKCGAPMVLRKPPKGKTWRPFYGCVRWRPRGEGCDGKVRQAAA
jgi:hypothetical protein